MTVAAEAKALDVARTADAGLEHQVQRRAGIYQLGAQSEAEFKQTVEILKTGLDRLDYIIENVLAINVDYDEPSYADSYVDRSGQKKKKKNLLLPGAEKLALLMRLCPTFEVMFTPIVSKNSPPVYHSVRCNLHLGSEEGPVVAQGVGSANSFEKKYRYRWVNNVRVDNPDPWDLDNTLLKMAKTRAFRDAVKIATGGSARLTQDLEDLEEIKATVQKPAAVGTTERPAVEGEGPTGPTETPGGPVAGSDPSTLSTVDLINDVLARATRLKKSLGDIFALVGVQRGDPQKKPRTMGEVSRDELLGVIRAWSD